MQPLSMSPSSPSPCRRPWRLVGLGLIALLLVFTLACIDRPMKRAIPDPHIAWTPSLPQDAERDVDLLFVVDNSVSMDDEQRLLRQNFGDLMQTLREMRGGLPNVHIGVTTTDLGTFQYPVGGCGTTGGGQGRLVTGACTNPQGAPYIIDVEPTGCAVDKIVDDDNGRLTRCEAHDCAATHCTEPGTSLVIDALGCPRCRNYAGETLEAVFACVADVGATGCGFEQPLEAMKKALDHHPDNVGFLRDGAFLGVVLITDEDDCSAANPQLFDDSQTGATTTLGPLHSFRCFEFGVTCNENARQLGPHTQCVPAEGPASLLHSLDRYRQFLAELRDPSRLVVAAIAGDNPDQSVNVVPDGAGWDLDFSCRNGTGEEDGARPGIRLREFVGSFNRPEDMAWAYTSICAEQYRAALGGIGEKITLSLDSCPPSPIQGCADPAVAFGLPGDGRDCNDTCAPQCTVREVIRQADGTRASQGLLPPCLEVCPAGACPGNADPQATYAGGHPARRDADLPVAACWYVNYNPACAPSNGGEILVARRADPPPRTFAEVACSNLPATEALCNDGRDNDGDCLIDYDDPDCAQYLE